MPAQQGRHPIPGSQFCSRQHAGEGTMMGKSWSRLSCEQRLQSDACSAWHAGVQGALTPELSKSGILLQVYSRAYSSGQNGSPVSAAWVREQIPPGSCSLSLLHRSAMGRDLLQPPSAWQPLPSTLVSLAGSVRSCRSPRPGAAQLCTAAELLLLPGWRAGG